MNVQALLRLCCLLAVFANVLACTRLPLADGSPSVTTVPGERPLTELEQEQLDPDRQSAQCFTGVVRGEGFLGVPLPGARVTLKVDQEPDQHLSTDLDGRFRACARKGRNGIGTQLAEVALVGRARMHSDRKVLLELRVESPGFATHSEIRHWYTGEPLEWNVSLVRAD